ncbi:unnamed protein product [Prorocentrum cordatum]|uniref:Uncharacterized protein n=1 Tax=Prorocentrum cordatum TaxID=2364126 RepID=A0ABN9UXK5_9DINO|nr:unnamed protein product [Polarella glacialis]
MGPRLRRNRSAGCLGSSHRASSRFERRVAPLLPCDFVAGGFGHHRLCVQCLPASWLRPPPDSGQPSRPEQTQLRCNSSQRVRNDLRKAIIFVAMLRLLLVAAFLSAASARELSQLELEPALAADDECDAVAGEPCGVQLLQARSSKESQMSSTVNSSDNMSSTEPSELPEADGPEDGEQLLQHDALVAEVQSGNFWFVSRKACGNTRGSAERLWAGQCQPALWDRSLSVRGHVPGRQHICPNLREHGLRRHLGDEQDLGTRRVLGHPAPRRRRRAGAVRLRLRCRTTDRDADGPAGVQLMVTDARTPSAWATLAGRPRVAACAGPVRCAGPGGSVRGSARTAEVVDVDSCYDVPTDFSLSKNALFLGSFCSSARDQVSACGRGAEHPRELRGMGGARPQGLLHGAEHGQQKKEGRRLSHAPSDFC